MLVRLMFTSFHNSCVDEALEEAINEVIEFISSEEFASVPKYFYEISKLRREGLLSMN